MVHEVIYEQLGKFPFCHRIVKSPKSTCTSCPVTPVIVGLPTNLDFGTFWRQMWARIMRLTWREERDDTAFQGERDWRGAASGS